METATTMHAKLCCTDAELRGSPELSASTGSELDRRGIEVVGGVPRGSPREARGAAFSRGPPLIWEGVHGATSLDNEGGVVSVGGSPLVGVTYLPRAGDVGPGRPSGRRKENGGLNCYVDQRRRSPPTTDGGCCPGDGDDPVPPLPMEPIPPYANQGAGDPFHRSTPSSRRLGGDADMDDDVTTFRHVSHDDNDCIDRREDEEDESEREGWREARLDNEGRAREVSLSFRETEDDDAANVTSDSDRKCTEDEKLQELPPQPRRFIQPQQNQQQQQQQQQPHQQQLSQSHTARQSEQIAQQQSPPQSPSQSPPPHSPISQQQPRIQTNAQRRRQAAASRWRDWRSFDMPSVRAAHASAADREGDDDETATRAADESAQSDHDEFDERLPSSFGNHILHRSESTNNGRQLSGPASGPTSGAGDFACRSGFGGGGAGIHKFSVTRRSDGSIGTSGPPSHHQSFSRRKPSLSPSSMQEFDINPQGRDFESIYTTHKYSSSERETMASHDSFDYLPSHSTVYKDWLRRQPARLDWDRWLMMGLIGVSIGVVGFLLHQLIHLIAELKWNRVDKLVHEGSLVQAWAWTLGYSVSLSAAGAATVVFISQSAGGSGIPEVIGFLNGIVMRRVLNLTAFCVKFVSCACAVGAGLPVGPEGPMIHIGSTVGTGLSQCRSRTFNITLPFFARFRNSEDRRNFTTAGAAAGVAAAFGAPVGGLLFAMEEVSSFWSMKLGWMIFFCCTLATFTADIFNSSFDAFHVVGTFGLFQTDKYIVFKPKSMIPVNVIMFIPAVILGLIGGVLGAAFTITNLKMARLRGHIMLSATLNTRGQNLLRFLEPPLIMILWATITAFLPAAFPCQPLVCGATTDRGEVIYGNSSSGLNGTNSSAGPGSAGLDRCPSSDVSGGRYSIDVGVQQYWCREPVKVNGTIVDGEYNEVASLVNVHIQKSLRLLYSRRTHFQFGYASLLVVLPFYFFFSCWAAGSAVSCGIVVPMLFIGGLYGRALGRLLVDLHGGVPTDLFWQWIDPGALALIGSASFFGGVTRLTMSLTVIMIEITNDVAFLLPTMVAILVSKWVGDYFTHPLYHSLLEHKCLPFLEAEPIVYDDQRNLLNLELFKARDVMHSPVMTITPRESLSHLAKILLETSHGGFPVVKYYETTRQEVYYGLLTRAELSVILCHEQTRELQTLRGTISPKISYEELAVDRTCDEVKLQQVLDNYSSNPLYHDVYIDLEPFINRSSSHIEEEFSLHRTYIVFRTLGLRHLTVVDMANRVVGLISRKDLMGFNLEEKLVQRKRRGYSIDGGITRLLPSQRRSAVATLGSSIRRKLIRNTFV